MRLILRSVLLVTLLTAGNARACPVCGANRGSQNQQSRPAWATLVTTGSMLLLPLGMVAGLAYWLRKNL
jgi:hypothetical protein